MSADAVIRMPDENTGVSLRGHPMVFLVTGEDTKHTSMFDWTIPAGFATGRHVHRVQEETFYLLEGECEWHVGDKTVRATAGTFLFIPPGVRGERVTEARGRLDAWRGAALPRERLWLERLLARLEPANVARMLERGFALVLRDGGVVRESGGAPAGAAVRIALRRGWLDARVDACDRAPDPLPGRSGGGPGAGRQAAEGSGCRAGQPGGSAEPIGTQGR